MLCAWRLGQIGNVSSEILEYESEGLIMTTADIISEVIFSILTERKLYIVKPQHPTMGEVALEFYGFGKPCDAVALQAEDLQSLLLEIGNRCAEALNES